MTDLTVDSTAREMAAAVRAREVSAVELMDLHLARIAERNPQLNAIVSLDEERARAGAAAADAALAAGDPVGPLHGLPFAFKDTHAVAGWRTTYGSPLHADHVPDHDELLVERVRGAGAVPIGKTNVPEFAAGSHTFNTIFGTTLNPVDPTRSAGGSSGGAACALRSGMVPLADGSDMGGSLRNPASFCGVVGLRPSLGRVPEWPHANAWESTSVGGPMARNVGDLALLLSVLAGPDPRAPLALGDPGSTFAPPLAGSLSGLRVALSEDLGGAFQVDDEVRSVVASSAAVFSGAGAQVAAAYPDLSLADDTFRTLRAWHFQARFGASLAPSTPTRSSSPSPTTSGRGSRSPVRTWPGPTGSAPRWPRRCVSSSRRTTCWCCRSRRCRRSRRTRSSRPRSTASRWRPTSTGCGRRTSSPSPAAPRSRSPPATPATASPSASRSSRRHGADRRLLEVAAAFESAVGPLCRDCLVGLHVPGA